jgi:hypothetical protein
MTKNNTEPRQPDYNAEKQSPNYRSKNSPRAEQSRECHTTAPPAAPSSAAENHKDANQKCETPAPKAASKDEREKATG